MKCLALLVFLLSSIPAFGSSENAGDLKGWEPHAQRPALMPVMSIEGGILSISSSGNLNCNGSWQKTVPVEGGGHYTFQAEYATQNVLLPRRSILASIDWKTAGGDRVSLPSYPFTGSTSGRWTKIGGSFQAPDNATSAVIDLIFRWDAQGEVQWRNAGLKPGKPLEARKVVLATVNYRPSSSSGPTQNIEGFARFLRIAGEKGADIVCLPEGVTVVGTGRSYLDVAEPIPGPSTRALGKIAEEHSMYIVAGLYEQSGDTYYNVSVLIDRTGEVAGLYRKVSLPRGEIESGLTPGSDFPVFVTDFGKVGMMICWDSQFPEAARRLASSGAEVIMLPIWGGSEPLIVARAIENQVFLVTSSFDTRTGIWNKRGELIAEAAEEGSVALSEVDLADVVFWEWVGNLRSHIPRESPPVREVER